MHSLLGGGASSVTYGIVRVCVKVCVPISAIVTVEALVETSVVTVSVGYAVVTVPAMGIDTTPK